MSDVLPTSQRPGWTVHDVLIGLLSGGGVGAVAGLYLVARVLDGDWVVPVASAIGALAGVFALVTSHRARTKFLTVTVIASWVLLVASAVFIVGLALAIANFQ